MPASKHGEHGEGTENAKPQFAGGTLGSKLIRPEISSAIIASALAVHRALGPGLLESTYESCLCRELSLRRLTFLRQVAIPVSYRGLNLDCGYRMDLLVTREVVVEVKAVETLRPVHRAQLLTYLRLSRLRLGLLINFNVSRLRDGITRVVL